MPSIRSSFGTLLCGLTATLLAACGGGGMSSGTLGGTVSGLASGTSLALADGRASVLSVSANGSFWFADQVPVQSAYNVRVVTQPTGQTCTVANGYGTVDKADVSDIAVVCANNASLTGITSGLPAGASVTLGDGNAATVISANGAFTLASVFAAGTSYNVNVSVVPAGTNCTLANGIGTVGAAADPITNLVVSCSSTGSLGGMVGGLAAGNALVLSNGVGSVTVSANGAFAFPDTFNPNDVYAVSLQSQTGTQTCSINSGTGTFDASATAINAVTVVCE